MKRLIVLALLLSLGACAPVADEATTSPDSTATTAPTSLTTGTVAPTTSTTQSLGTSLTSSSTTISSSIGEIVDFGPRSGDELIVVGVEHDDALNLRAAPGTSQPVIDQLPPTYEGLVALGETRQFEDAFWIHVESAGKQGWVHLGFIAYMGATTDLTSEVVSDFGGYPTADDLEELGSKIAQSLASEDPPSNIVLVVRGSVGDLGEITYDVIGLGDDSVFGLRIHVFATPEGDSFTLKAVEVTALCGRGVTGDGLCT